MHSPRQGQDTNPYHGVEAPLLEKFVDECEERRRLYPQTYYILNTFFVKWLLDWIGLLTFYSLLGSVPFAVASGAALGAGLIAMSFTHIRSLLDSLVSSPKVLDIGFIVTFIVFTILGLIGHDCAIITQCWSNFLMDFALGLIVVVGVVAGDPFIKPYAIEAGFPAQLATTPFALVLLSEASMQWAYCFFAMSAVSMPAPVYRCVSVGCAGNTNSTYTTINAVFTYGCQYFILFAMMVKDFYFEPRHAKAVQEWIDREPEDYISAHGAPLGADGAPISVDVETGVILETRTAGAAVLTTLRDDRAGGSDDDIKTAAKTLAAAFVDDPFFAIWVTRSGQASGSWKDPASREGRITAMQSLFAAMVRASRRFNHCFVVDGGVSYNICIPSWPEVDAMERVVSNQSLTRHNFPLDAGMPPIEYHELTKIMHRALRNREHLYVFLFATNPANQGQGLGRVGMQAAIRVADSRRVPMALETMTNKNRRIYEKYGFEVVGQIVISECSDPWYCMIREPMAHAAAVAVQDSPSHSR